ncbi:hypothetical protein RRG08_054602 [Elysia crispata]|uniref:Uncharacterized protein n=1 Tax=Elysia crispata TaxID=231223 RepID=A0AAE1B0K1_9GAST|nr:hypothetical protein RRG08_054602 [Elysia crispata]
MHQRAKSEHQLATRLQQCWDLCTDYVPHLETAHKPCPERAYQLLHSVFQHFPAIPNGRPQYSYRIRANFLKLSSVTLSDVNLSPMLFGIVRLEKPL